MYKSPIEIISDEIATMYEDGIMKVVTRYAVNCDKEELLRALSYDRNQYCNGYKDGRADAIPIEYIHRRIETLNEYISKWGGSFEHEEMVNAYIHEVSALIRLVTDWRKEE